MVQIHQGPQYFFSGCSSMLERRTWDAEAEGSIPFTRTTIPFQFQTNRYQRIASTRLSLRAIGLVPPIGSAMREDLLRGIIVGCLCFTSAIGRCAPLRTERFWVRIPGEARINGEWRMENHGMACDSFSILNFP